MMSQPIDEVEPALVEGKEIAEPEEDPGNGRRQDQEEVQRPSAGPLPALHEPPRE